MIGEQGLRALWHRVLLMAGIGRVATVDDSGPVQILQLSLLDDETKDTTPNVQNYGFSGVPPAGTDVVVLCIGGERTNMVAIGSNNPSLRPTGLQPGDVVMYDSRGRMVKITAAGILVEGGSDPVQVHTTGDIDLSGANINVTGNLKVTGATTFTGTVKANGHSIDETHKHTGVTPGGSLTGTVS